MCEFQVLPVYSEGFQDFFRINVLVILIDILKIWEEEFYLVNQHIFTLGPLRLDSLWDSRGTITFLSQKYLSILLWSRPNLNCPKSISSLFFFSQ